ncbi:MAG TPA: SURF1 family protein [Steroidobacteraceae bacterium]|nr:SURF1 family protein [Steroidobacteraceae bacterium]
MPQSTSRKHYIIAGALLTIAGVAAFTKLGLWQWHRADEKRELLQAYARGDSTLAVTDTVDTLPRYQRAELHGSFDADHQILLDNMPSAATGQPGYRVLTPFNTGREWVLVDRGWVPLGRTRNDWPSLAVDESARIVRGRVDDLPEPGIRLGEQSVDPKQPWPRVLNFPTYPMLRAMLPSPLAPRIVLLDADSADGFERVWQMTLRVSPERHIAYAVQWFAFAAAAIVIYLVLVLKKRTHHHVQ